MSEKERKTRGIKQNLFLIEMKNNSEKYEKEFMVMGSTGNVYVVIIGEIPTCTCPDFITRNKRCKHIYFILIRVMKSKNEDCEIYTENDLKEMYKNIPIITSNLLVDEKIKKNYDKLKLKNKFEFTNDSLINKKETNDICPICLEDLENGEILDYCKYSCGKSIHKICFSMWCKQKKANCVYCRADWFKNKSSPYININEN